MRRAPPALAIGIPILLLAAALAAAQGGSQAQVYPGVRRRAERIPFELSIELERAQADAAHGAKPDEGPDLIELADRQSEVQRHVPIADSTPRSMRFSGLELGQAVELIAEQANLNLVVPVTLSEPVSVAFPSVTLQAALESLLQIYHLRVLEVDGIYHVVPEPVSGLETKVFRLRSVDPASIQDELAITVGSGGTIVPNSLTDTVLITASPEGVRRAERFLRAVDLPDRQVLIHARLFEVSLSDSLEIGVRLGFNKIDAGNAVGSIVSNMLTPSRDFEGTIAQDDGDIDAALRMLASVAKVDLLANPRLVAIDNQDATIDIIQRIPYIGSTVSTDVGNTTAATSTVQQVAFQEVGIRLKVRPAIQRDGNVQISVHQEVSEANSFFQGVPVVDSRTLDTRFIVGDGSTIVIGGLLQEKKRDEESGVPLLKDIPLLGFLFRRTTTTTDKVNLVVFITPRLVAPEEAQGLSSEFHQEYQQSAEDYGIGEKVPPADLK